MAERKVHLDLSKFSAEEKAQYDALVAKASVDPEAAQDEMEDDAFHEEDYNDPYVTFGQVEADFD